MKGKIIECESCGYRGIRWNTNLVCKECGGLVKVIGEEKEEIRSGKK